LFFKGFLGGENVLIIISHFNIRVQYVINWRVRLKYSVSEDIARDKDVVSTPDLRFITILLIFSRGFPWDKFLLFFQDKKLMSYEGEDQVFLLRLLAVQEFLCIDDEALLKWVKHQFQLIGFLHMGYKATVPSVELLASFRTTLDTVGILAPFRQQCQKLIMMHDEKQPKDDEMQLIPEVLNWGSQRVIGVKADEIALESEAGADSRSEKEVSWIACPVCKSQNINRVLPPHWVAVKEEDWCRCRFCGNKFKVLISGAQ
jgi:hypothetical protein